MMDNGTLIHIKQGRINRYRCNKCSEAIVTIDRVEGTTPMMIMCKATKGCFGTMYSEWYQCDQGLFPTWEWYRPANLKNLDRGSRDHVKRGGLVLQRIPANDQNIQDPNLRRAVIFVQGLNVVSAAVLQRQFRITYMTAANMLSEMVQARIIEEGKDKKGQHQVIQRISKGIEIYEEVNHARSNDSRI